MTKHSDLYQGFLLDHLGIAETDPDCLERELEKLETDRDQLRTELDHRGEELEAQTMKSVHLREQLAARDREAVALRHELGARDRKISTLEGTLAEIHSGLSWRLLSLYRSALDAGLPRDSLRRQLWDGGLGLLKGKA